MTQNGSLDYFSTLEIADLKSRLVNATQARTGFLPYDYQVDAAVALCRKQDVILVSGTGSGKSLAMVMPCFLSSRMRAVIFSPLNALELNQVCYMQYIVIYVLTIRIITLGSEIQGVGINSCYSQCSRACREPEPHPGASSCDSGQITY